MNIVVVYKSESGFTAQYAKWIAEELHSECYDIKDLKPGKIKNNTTIVFGGSLHATGINGYKKLKQLIASIEYKELVVFAVGASPAKNGVEKEIIESNFKTKKEKEIHLFYLRGGFDYSKLNFWNKMLMTLLKIKIKSKNENKRTGDEKGMLASYEKPLNATKHENIYEITKYVVSINI